MNQEPASSPAPSTGSGQLTEGSSTTVSLRLPAKTPGITYSILALTIFVFILQFVSVRIFGNDPLIAVAAKNNDAIRAGQLWRLFTPMLLHDPFSLWHVGFNMYALYSLGPGLERRLGHERFLLLYVLSGFAGNVLSFLRTDGISVGASTAVFGVIAAEAVFLFQNRRLFGRETRGALSNVIFVILFNLFLGFSSRGLIDNWGHIGGLLGGILFTAFAGPLWEVRGVYPDLRLADKRAFRDIVLGAGLVILIFGGLAWWGIFYG